MKKTTNAKSEKISQAPAKYKTAHSATKSSRIAKRIPVSKRKIAGFCKRWMISEFSLFGSVLRDDFRPDSDIDILVTFQPQAQWSLWDIAEMQEELKKNIQPFR